jgi:predicted DNA-binding protein (MmcQ/YjbR family)
MSLHSAKAFSKFVTGMAGVTTVEQWGSLVAKVGGKVFALVAVDGTDVVFKVGEISFDGLTSLEGVGQAPYFAKRQWVSVGKDAALSDAELKGYIKASYDTIARKLTRKLRAELGISVD